MKKPIISTSSVIALTSSVTAHVSHSSNNVPEEGIHATPLQVLLIAALAILVAGMLYYGFSRQTGFRITDKLRGE